MSNSVALTGLGRFQLLIPGAYAPGYWLLPFQGKELDSIGSERRTNVLRRIALAIMIAGILHGLAPRGSGGGVARLSGWNRV